MAVRTTGSRCLFQPTLPARGATLHQGVLCRRKIYFNPRSPHGERRRRRADYQVTGDFNPRSPHGERPAMIATLSPKKIFQPTLPARGATLVDTHRLTNSAFQPTLPARGATSVTNINGADVLFQPTLPARGATIRSPGGNRACGISTHAPRTGSDRLQPTP